MAGISSLLKSAESTRKKIQAQQDSLVAFEWENSAQTYDDFLSYSNYLNQQAEKTSDPSEQLTYATKVRSARRSFTSNELQRQQMKIMEGQGTTQDKMAAVEALWSQAVDNQDFNLAQNLLSQWDALSIKLQNEQESAFEAQQRALKSASSAQAKSVKDLLNKLEYGVDFIELADGNVVKPLAMLSRELEKTGGSQLAGGGQGPFWQEANDTIEAIRSVIIDQYQGADTQDEIDQLEKKYGLGLQDLNEKLTFKIGGRELNGQQLAVAAENEAMNNPIYSLRATRNEATGQNEFKLRENNVERLEYTRQIDPNTGEEYFAPTTVRTDQNDLFFGQSDQGRGTGTQITDEGFVIGGEIDGEDKGNIALGSKQVARDEGQSIGNRLKALGIIAKQEGTTLKIKLPGESVERQAVIQPDGSIRYYDDDGKLLELGLTRRNLGTEALPQIFEPGQLREVSAEETPDFARPSAFGGYLSRASQEGERYLADILGRGRVEQVAPFDMRTARLTGVGSPLLRGPIRVGNDFSGRGTAVTSSLLQSAKFTQDKIELQAEQARQAMLQAQAEAAARLQAAAPTFNLNQVPVSQMTSQGILKRQLQVKPLPAQPRLYVAPPAPTPRITSVGVAQPTGRVTVSNSTGYAGSLKVR